MSLPPWKQALLHRRKKQEDEQKKRRTEEDAQLASLPPWKRALLLKQREKKEKEAGVASKEVAVERSDSFSKWKNQTQKKSEETRPPWVKKATANAPRTGGSISTAGRSYSVGSKPTTTTTRNSSNATSSPQVQKRVRRESVTVVPDPEDTPILLAFKRTNSPEPGSPSLVRSLGPISLRKKKQEPVNIKEKRRSFEDHDDKFASMPAWKKALILRRRAEASKQESQEKQDEQDGLEQKEKKPQAIAECQPAKQEGKTSVPLERKPDMAAVQRGNEPSREAEERDTSTVSQERPRTYSSPAASKRSAPPRPASRPAPTRTAPRPPPASSAPNAPPTPPTSKAPPKSITPKISQTATAPKTIPTSTAPKASSTASQKATHATKISASSRSRPAPEIVNRKEAENAASNKLVQQEGVTLHAPVFKEVDQWANVSQDDPKFKNLPSWKQALILRRRADIAKRTGSTSSSRTPSPVQPLSEEGHVKTAWSPRNSFDEAKSPNVPLWKQEFLKKKQSAGDSGMGKKQEKESSSKQKNISSARSPIKGGNVKALLGKFNQGGSGASTFSTNKPNLSHPSAPSRHTLQITSRSGSEDVSSNSSDEELEEIPLTNIDEVSTDEEDDDDSGISAGGSIPKTGSPEHSRPANRTLEFSNEPNKPSILSVPVKKPQKVKIYISPWATTSLSL